MILQYVGFYMYICLVAFQTIVLLCISRVQQSEPCKTQHPKTETQSFWVLHQVNSIYPLVSSNIACWKIPKLNGGLGT